MSKKIRVIFFICIIVAGIAASGYGQLREIRIVPEDTSVTPGSSVMFNSHVINTQGVRLDTTANWQLKRIDHANEVFSDSTNIASITENGVLHASGPGLISVRVRLGNQFDTAKVEISDAGEFETQIYPGDTLIATGDTIRYRAKMRTSSGSIVDTSFTWTISNNHPDVPTANESEIGNIDLLTGVFVAENAGKAEIIAKAGTVVERSTVTVVDTNQVFIEIRPRDPTIRMGTQQKFRASIRNYQGKIVDRTIEWSVSTNTNSLPKTEKQDEAAIGTITSSGLFKATLEGSGRITASVGDYQATTDVFVIDKPIYRIQISPVDTSIWLQDTVRYQAGITDTTGFPVDTVVQWEVMQSTGNNANSYRESPTDVGTIDSTGIFTGQQKGRAIVRASLGNAYGLAAVKILRPADYKLTIQQDPDTLIIGEQRQYSAQLTDSSGAAIDTALDWSVQHPEDDEEELEQQAPVGTIGDEGRFVAENSGTAEIVVKFGPVQASAPVTVIDTSSAFNIDVAPRDTVIWIGDTLQYATTVREKTGSIIDTVLQWHVGTIATDTNAVVSSKIGAVDSSGRFIAHQKGTAKVIASVGNSKSVAHITVKDTADYIVQVQPADTTIVLGDTVRFSATAWDYNGRLIDTLYQWRLQRIENHSSTASIDEKENSTTVGTIDSAGLFIAQSTGRINVQGRVGASAGLARIYVRDTTRIDTSLNAISITYSSQKNQKKQVEQILEGEIYQFQHFSYPLHLLNGGYLHVPKKSLEEDVSIRIEQPDFAQVKEDSSISFPEDIVAAATFKVTIGDSTVQPYYFKQPVEVSLPYCDTLQPVGFSPEQLGMYYYSPSAGFDSTGVSELSVDTANNRVSANVDHLSTLVLIDKSVVSGVKDADQQELPNEFVLGHNYPNPFNPVTQIKYTIPRQAPVEIGVYNMLGQKVQTLVNKVHSPGEYTISFNGTGMSSGMYYYQLRSGSVVQTRKMMLVK